MSERFRSRYWQDLTTAEISAADMGTVVALLPVAATEQHGPHLPLSVDADINRALVDRIVATASDDLPLLVLPALAVGVSPEHADFAGTLSLSAETMIRLLEEIGDGVAAAGVRKLVLFNTHGGQPQILDIVAQKLRRRHGMLAVPMNAYRFWDAAAEFGADEAAHGIHAGAAETSIMLEIAADRVRTGSIRDFASLSRTMAAEFAHLRPFGRIAGFGWQAQDLNPSGAVGDAGLASAEAGARLLDQAAAKALAIIGDLAVLSPGVLRGDGA